MSHFLLSLNTHREWKIGDVRGFSNAPAGAMLLADILSPETGAWPRRSWLLGCDTTTDVVLTPPVAVEAVAPQMLEEAKIASTSAPLPELGGRPPLA